MHPASAGLWELRRRAVLLATLIALSAIIVLGVTRVIDGASLGVVVIVVVVIAAAIVWRIGQSQSAAVAREKAGGYSTLYDFEGYEVRDARTGAVVRRRDEPTGGGIRRSLVTGMLTASATSALGRRLADEPGRADSAPHPDVDPEGDGATRPR